MAPFCVQRAGLGTGACNLIAAWCSEHCASLWQRRCSVGRRRGQRRCSQYQQASALSLGVWEHFCHLVASPRDPVGACCPEKVAERRRLFLGHPQHRHPGGINKVTASHSGTGAHGDILHPARPPSTGKCRPASVVQTSHLVALQTPLLSLGHLSFLAHSALEQHPGPRRAWEAFVAGPTPHLSGMCVPPAWSLEPGPESGDCAFPGDPGPCPDLLCGSPAEPPCRKQASRRVGHILEAGLESELVPCRDVAQSSTSHLCQGSSGDTHGPVS